MIYGGGHPDKSKLVLKRIYSQKTNDSKFSILLEPSSQIPVFSAPKSPENYRTRMDYVALAIIHQTSRNFGEAIPLVSMKNGTCLFSSLSILLSSDNSLLEELKLRAMLYLAQNHSKLDQKAGQYMFSRHSASPKGSLELLYKPDGWSSTWVVLTLSMQGRSSLPDNVV